MDRDFRWFKPPWRLSTNSRIKFSKSRFIQHLEGMGPIKFRSIDFRPGWGSNPRSSHYDSSVLPLGHLSCCNTINCTAIYFFKSRNPWGIYSLELFILANSLTKFACGMQFGARVLNFGKDILDLSAPRTHDHLIPSQERYHSATGAVVSSSILM